MAQINAQTGPIATRGRAVCDIGEDVRSAVAAWYAALDGCDEAIALYGGAAAAETMRQAWRREFAVYIDVLEQWCTAAKAAAAGFASVDDYAATKVGRQRPTG